MILIYNLLVEGSSLLLAYFDFYIYFLTLVIYDSENILE